LVFPVALLAAVLGGAGAVAAEVVFTRKLALLFGVTAPAAATVVAVYMAGMALGAGLGGRLADRLGRRVVPLYLGLELLGAAWAAAFPTVFVMADEATISLPAEVSLLVFGALTALLVGPAAVASGATFPALTRLVGRELRVRQLYAANAGGAALGGLVAGLWLPAWLGLRGTLYVAATLMLCAGLVMAASAWNKAPVEPELQPAPPDPVSPRLGLLAYAAIGGMGMGAEIGWTRLLQQTGPNPGSLTFPMVLATYLMGLALGGLFLEPVLRRRGERRALGICALMAGLSTLLVMALLPIIPEERLIGHLVGPSPGNGLIFALTGVQISIDRLVIYLTAVLVPGLASGAGFPIAVSAMARARKGLGTGVGLTGAVGIGAAVVVSLWMGFLPSWGPGTVRLTVLLGVAALVVAAAILKSRRVGVLALVGCGAFFVRPWDGLQIPPDETVLAFVETASGPSAVAQGRLTSVYTHGERVAGLKLDLEFPLALHPDPAEVLVIAFGTGINIRGFLRDPAVTDLTCVDIDPALPELATHIPDVGGGLFDGERSHFVHDDGRHLLRQSDRTWDVVYSDVATYAQYIELGTVEFFELTRARLAPGGVFALKLHPDTLSVEGLERFLATFLAVYPEAVLFGRETPVPVLVGFPSGVPERAMLEARAAEATVYGRDVDETVVRYTMLGADGLARFANGPVATDDRPLELRDVLVGPITAENVASSALPVLITHVAEHGAADVRRTWAEYTELEPVPWGPSGFALNPRRGWFQAPTDDIQSMLPGPGVRSGRRPGHRGKAGPGHRR